MKKTTRRKEEDINTLAFSIVEQATSSAKESHQKNPAAVELGRLGGLKGGHARAKKLTAEQRKAIARKAALSRWKSK